MKALYDQISADCAKRITTTYSTSFSLGIKALSKELHDPIYAIYGFVRVADEIVDSFHDYPKRELMEQFEKDTYRAIELKISTNPVLNAFQKVCNDYEISLTLIDSFLKSMKMDLEKKEYSREQYDNYIVGSAEVVGLMCLTVFCNKNNFLYESLKPNAMRLGAAFQKINFLRDLKEDYVALGRCYFPNINVDNMNDQDKLEIEKDIQADFKEGLKGIKMLPRSSRFGVYLAYVYFYALFRKIQNVNANNVISERIRLPNYRKSWLIIRSLFQYHLYLK